MMFVLFNLFDECTTISDALQFELEYLTFN